MFGAVRCAVRHLPVQQPVDDGRPQGRGMVFAEEAEVTDCAAGRLFGGIATAGLSAHCCNGSKGDRLPSAFPRDRRSVRRPVGACAPRENASIPVFSHRRKGSWDCGTSGPSPGRRCRAVPRRCRSIWARARARAPGAGQGSSSWQRRNTVRPYSGNSRRATQATYSGQNRMTGC